VVPHGLEPWTHRL